MVGKAEVGSSEALGRLLRRARAERKVSQAELARRLGMSAPNLSRIEHGADFRVSTLLEISRELKLEPVLISKDRLTAVRALLERPDGVDEAPVERGRFV